MILPIIAYGAPILKRKGAKLDKSFPKLEQIIENMYKTMYQARGVGLAAPQIDLSIRLFIVDSKDFIKSEYEGEENKNPEKPIKEVFINPEITKHSKETIVFNEGCLSIPTIREDIVRPEKIKIKFWDENFKKKTMQLEGINARVVLHEFDHIEGILFVDHVKPLKKRLLKKKLAAISRGDVDIDYKMYFPTKKK